MKITERKRGRAAVEDRARIMRRDCGLCQACLLRGIIKPATVVDHIVALVNGGDDRDTNKRCLCDECHTEKTRQDLGLKPSGACDTNGLPIAPGHHWNV